MSVPENMAFVTTDEEGRVVLFDPEAAALIQAVNAQNCRAFYQANADGVTHFCQRFREKGYRPADVCMIIADVDDPNGAQVADVTMPGHDWDSVRAQGLRPVARGLYDREIIQKMVEIIDPIAGEQMRTINGLVAAVVSSGTALIFALDL